MATKSVSKKMRGDGMFNYFGYDPNNNNSDIITYRIIFKAITNLKLWDFVAAGPPYKEETWSESEDIRVYNIVCEMERLGHTLDGEPSFMIAIRLMEYLAKFGEKKLREKVGL